ncbi:M48 family metallopeptidase [Sodalinema gerasimenkoae]|uniref:M48 family metallopeptidase n=1 Tax=Sodalinema gerasimenkoae TaxID=2862348 RepID=UPI0013598DF0|nr:M48 family metallopeptidase [Sodalinema gerasimenkoae]
MGFKPKAITEEVNISKVNPLVDFARLLGAIIALTLVIYFILGLAVDWVVPQLTPEQDIWIGDTLAPAVAPQLGGEVLEEDTRQLYLSELLEDLCHPGDLDETPLTLNLIDSEVVNAAALAGGQLFVTTAFLEEVESENELAFVLGHELGHLSARDGLRSLGRGIFVLLGSLVLNFGHEGSGPDVIGYTLNLNRLNYSRSQEYAADEYGLESVVGHYGHGANSLDFFERLAARKEAFPEGLVRASEYFQTHPLTENRIQHLDAIAREEGWSMTGETTPVPSGLACADFACNESPPDS